MYWEYLCSVFARLMMMCGLDEMKKKKKIFNLTYTK